MKRLAFIVCALAFVSTAAGARTRAQTAKLHARKRALSEFIEISKAAPLSDVTYSFDPAKLDVADDAFHFLRSYVDYYYLLAQANRAQLPTLNALADVGGWCVGDPHPENFGVLIQEDDSSIFTINDIDDAGPCPLAWDLSRFLVASTLYDSSLDIADLLKAYRHGLEGKTDDQPDVVSEMFDDSSKKGERPEKSRVDANGLLIRSSQSREVDSAVLAQLTTAYKTLFPRHADLVDVMETSKVGGGSGGLRRYELLVKDANGLVNLEMKEEVRPSVYPVAKTPLPDFSTRINQTLLIEQGPSHSAYLSTFVIDGREMISRPRFAGNVGAALDKNSGKENRALILYEAFILGRIHARSVDGSSWSARVKAADEDALGREIESLSKRMSWKFSKLKPI